MAECDWRFVYKEFLYVCETDGFEEIGAAAPPITGPAPYTDQRHAWIHLLGFDVGVPGNNIMAFATELSYKPPDHRRLKREYEEIYEESVAPIQQSGRELDGKDKRALSLTKQELSTQNLRLIGAFAVYQDSLTGNVSGTPFISKILIKNMGLALHERSLNAEFTESLIAIGEEYLPILTTSLFVKLLPKPESVSLRFLIDRTS